MSRSSRLALFTNAESGEGSAAGVADLLRWHGAVVYERDLADAAAPLPTGTQRLAVAGGDGSIGPVAALAERTGLSLAVIAAGTANDFARAMNLPDDPGEAARLAALATRTRPIDLGWMGERPFVNAASLGLPPVAARKADGFKAALGQAAYALGAVRAAASANPVRCSVSCDGQVGFEGSAWQVTVACSGAFGGGAGVEADPRDGLLDAVAIEAGSRARLAMRAYGLRRGTIESQRGVSAARGSRIEVEVEGATDFNVDGEVVRSGSVGFSVDPRAVDLVVA